MKLEFYLSLDKGLSDGICVRVWMELDRNGFVFDKPLVVIADMNISRLSTSAEWICNWAYARVEGREGDTYASFYL